MYINLILIICAFIGGLKGVEKVDWQMNNIEGEVIDIKWCKDDKNVLILTDLNHIYQSQNRGQSWRALRQQLLKLGNKELEFDSEQVGEVKAMFSSPVDDELIFFQGTHDINWFTTNCGDTIQAMNTGRPVDEIQWHPVQRDWLLVAAWNKCDDFQIDQECEIYKEVFFSNNLGQEWVLLEKYIYYFGWAKLNKESKVPDSRIIIAHETFGKGHQQSNGWSENIHIYQSDDYFKSKQILVPQGNSFVLTDNYFFVVKVLNKDDEDVELLIANPHQSQYQFKAIDSPVKKLRQHGYTVLDTSEGQVFININHGEGNEKFGNIYISDTNGIKYSSSLANNVRTQDGFCDFEKLQSLEGVYLANVYDSTKIDLLKQGQKFQISDSQREKSNYVQENLNRFIKTKISHNKGGAWKPLNPPKFDKNNKTFQCQNPDECHLHLNSHSSSSFGPYYSSKNAIAILIGTGNVGTYLSERQEQQGTFLSRDAGKTWQHIAEGSHIYELGDHGGILVMANDQEATNEILYSWDEGLSWETIKLDEKIQVRNIVTEPSNTGQHFIIYGFKSNEQGVLVYLDFSSLHKRTCQGKEIPDSLESDFELWTLYEDNGQQQCILGKSQVYLRKKQQAQCFNEEETEKLYSQRNCACTMEDWECDIGYWRHDDQQCISKKGITYNEPLICESTFEVSQGYRKVVGSSCEGGIDKSPIVFKCGQQSLNRKMLFIGIFLTSMLFLFYLNQSFHCFDGIYYFIQRKMEDPTYYFLKKEIGICIIKI